MILIALTENEMQYIKIAMKKFEDNQAMWLRWANIERFTALDKLEAELKEIAELRARLENPESTYDRRKE